MRLLHIIGSVLLLAAVLLFGAAPCPAFSLLGPYANWMDHTNGYRLGGDIGGPMNIRQGYRWNVPIVTYAFDQSFLEFFGSNGVSAVERSIQILNRLPPASRVVLTNYPLSSLQENLQAEGQGLHELKSVTLSLLLEQMGLAPPTRNVYTLRRSDSYMLQFPTQPEWPAWFIPFYVLNRNFDPKTLGANSYVNGTLFYGIIVGVTNSGVVASADVDEYAADPSAATYTAVADGTAASSPGCYYTGLTRDDVGGLRYLLSRDTVNYEILLSDVHPAQPPPLPPPPQNSTPYQFVNGAFRPGIEKVTFVRHKYDAQSRNYSPITYHYLDTSIVSGVVKYQILKRSVVKPDFLFATAGFNDSESPPLFARSAASNWWNSAAASANLDRTGPGIIRPPITITFSTNASWFVSP